MPKYRFTLSWDDPVEFHDRDRAKEHLQEIWDEVEQLGTLGEEDRPTLVTFDVQALPAQGRWKPGQEPPPGPPALYNQEADVIDVEAQDEE